MTTLSSPTKHLILIGGRGVGKSTVGQQLAERYHLPFVSTDALIESSAGSTILEIVEAQGWQAFRQLEAVALHSAVTGPTSVIDTGGGIVCAQDADGTQSMNQANIDRMRSQGVVIWLRQDLAVQQARIQGATHIPALTTSADRVLELADVMRIRAPWYAAAAHQVLDIQRMSTEQLVTALWEIYQTECHV